MNPANITVTNQHVYLLDNASVNVFDGINKATGLREVYYIQRGRIPSGYQFTTVRQGQNRQYVPETLSDDSEDDLPRHYHSSSGPSGESRYISILSSSKRVTDLELRVLANKLRFEDDKYRQLASYLRVSQEDQERIEKQLQNNGASRKDIIYSVLRCWKVQCSEPAVRLLGKALEQIGLKKFVTQTLEP